MGQTIGLDGRPLPDFQPLHNYEAEIALLAALLAANPLWYRIKPRLRSEHFADPLHGRIYAATGRMVDAGQKADYLTLKAEFDRDPALQDANGRKYLQRLTGSVVTIVGAEDYAEAIRDLWLRREIAARSESLRHELDQFDTPPDQVIGRLMADLARLSTEGRETAQSRRQVAEQLYESVSRPAIFTPTGIETLDEILCGGFFAGQLYGISGRKKAGKSALMGGISYNLDRLPEPAPHAIFSLEMQPFQIEMRNAARYLGINAMAFLNRRDPDLGSKAADYATSASDRTIYEHCPGASLDEICNGISRCIIRHRIKGAIIDFWQLVGGKGKNETEEYHLRMVAERFATIVRRENIWLMVGCQLNQEGNTRGGEGLRIATDMLLALHHEPGDEGAWLEMQDSRWTPYRNLGSEEVPGLWFHKNGTYFDDKPPKLPPGTPDLAGDLWVNS